MTERLALAAHFEEHRPHLRGVAYRMLGSLGEADDAVQEAWLRLTRADSGDVENLRAWLSTVVARVCLDMLRARSARREEPLEAHAERAAGGSVSVGGPGFRTGADPENEAQMAEAVGLALLVVLDRLGPAERLAFVLHNMFGVPFDEIARVVGRTPAAARQLASRARRRVRGAERVPHGDVARQRAVVDAFLAALRAGDLEGLLAVLDPDLVVRADADVSPAGPTELRGTRAWASQAVAFGRAARSARVALVDGAVGVVMAPRGRLFRVLRFAFDGGRIREIEVVGEAGRLRGMALALLDR